MESSSKSKYSDFYSHLKRTISDKAWHELLALLVKIAGGNKGILGFMREGQATRAMSFPQNYSLPLSDQDFFAPLMSRSEEEDFPGYVLSSNLEELYSAHLKKENFPNSLLFIPGDN